jgi:hypothetical protein
MRCVGLLVLIVLGLGGVAGAQDAPKPEDPAIVELKALVFILQTQLNAVEKELAREKSRRVELEEAELRRARETLDPDVKKKLGLPVPDAPKPDEKVAPQTPPK